MVFEDVPSATIAADRLRPGMASTELLVASGVAASKSEAARLIKQGGVSINDVKLTDERGTVTLDHSLNGSVYVIRKGRRQTHVVRVT